MDSSGPDSAPPPPHAPASGGESCGTPRSWRSLLSWLGLPLLCWLLLPLLGLPGAHENDDLVFVPPAIELAEGRTMSNPLLHDFLSAWHLRTDRWFAHPPLYPAILSGWIKAFGASSQSFLWYEAAVNVAVQCLLLAFCRRLRLHLAWSLALGIVYFCGTLHWGLRPEAATLLLMLAGVVCLLSPGVISWGFGSAALTAAAFVLPQAVTYAVGLWVAAAAWSWFTRETAGRRLLAALLIGTLPVLLAFHFAVGGEWSAFLSDFLAHVRYGMGGEKTRWDIFSGYVRATTQGLDAAGAILMLLALCTCVFGAWRTRHGLHRALLLAIPFAFAANMVLVIPAGYRIVFMMFVACVAAVPVIAQWRRRRTRLVAALVLTGIPLALEAPSLLARLLREPDNIDEVRAFVAAHPGAKIYCDSPVIRYVCDWHPWPNTQSLAISHEGHVVLPPGSVLIEGEWRVAPRQLHFLGHTFTRVAVNIRRWRCSIVPSSGPAATPP